MKNAYKSSGLHMHLQCFVSSSAETSNYTSAYDLKSVVLPHEAVWLWPDVDDIMSAAELNLAQRTHHSTHDSFLMKYCVLNGQW